jgi:hypothetical protein
LEEGEMRMMDSHEGFIDVAPYRLLRVEQRVPYVEELQHKDAVGWVDYIRHSTLHRLTEKLAREATFSHVNPVDKDDPGACSLYRWSIGIADPRAVNARVREEEAIRIASYRDGLQTAIYVLKMRVQHELDSDIAAALSLTVDALRDLIKEEK